MADEEDRATIGYFSMEIAVADEVPTYSGGLGVLAGDHLRAAADLGLPLVAVTLLYRSGYFQQLVDASGNQREKPVPWSPDELLEPLDVRERVEIGGRSVVFRAWRYRVVGRRGHEVPVYFLDTALEDNDEHDRSITDLLYGGGPADRLRQESLLGFGGLALLECLGLKNLTTYHLNEGHCALVPYALWRGAAGGRPEKSPTSVAAVKAACVFTTHTPVPAGHDVFSVETVREVLGAAAADELAGLGGLVEGELNMTRLAMALSGYVNAVSLRHRTVSQEMFPTIPVRSITNGVHVRTWVAPSLGELFDRHLAGWEAENATLRGASAIPLAELAAARWRAKEEMVGLIAERTGTRLDPGTLTLGVARRATEYKRNDLLLADAGRLTAIASRVGPIQIVYAGKAHPNDEGGKAMIMRINRAARALRGRVAIVFVADYSMRLAATICAGCDVWVNTPARPHEASGTSGMKAALNGVPSLSTLDGWWLEGHLEGITGWSIGDDSDEQDDAADAADLYDKLESVVAPLYYASPEAFTAIGRSAIALNGSYFTTERMVRQYAALAYSATGEVASTRRGSLSDRLNGPL
jgi:glycogen phosphorylase